MSSDIKQFTGEYKWLSNFYPVKINYLGLEFPSVEHAYQASKTSNTEVHKQIASIKHPGEAKRFGRTVPLESHPDSLAKEIIMYWLNCQKFKVPFLREKLLETEHLLLIEGNYWHDNFWGDCLCKKCIKVVGKNTLGIILQTIRDEIRQGYHKIEDTQV